MITTKDKGTFLSEKNAFHENTYLDQRQQTDYTSRLLTNKVYDSLLSCIENKQVQSVNTGKILPTTFYPLVRKELIQSGEFSASHMDGLEQSIINHAENLASTLR